MDISILTCLRYARVRLVDSIERQREIHPIRERFMGLLRVILLPSYIPLSLPLGVEYFLPSAPSPNSKSAAVFNELIEAGVSRSKIWTPPFDQRQILRRLLRVFARLPLAIFVLLKRFRSGYRLDWVDTYIILGRQVYRTLLRSHPQLIPIIISDVSPALHMLWSAAAKEGNCAIWWQDDYHHFDYFPYPVKAAVVLNEKALLSIRQRYGDVRIFMRTQTAVQPMRQIPKNPRVGVATNGFFDATKDQRILLLFIKENLDADKLRLRLHPNSKLTGEDFPEPWIDVAPANESLEDFAQRVDTVVVGNSAVQLRLLYQGVPVFHIAGFDEYGFDLYKYCHQGYVVGFEILEQLTISSVIAFYSEKYDMERLEKYMTVLHTNMAEALRSLNDTT